MSGSNMSLKLLLALSGAAIAYTPALAQTKAAGQIEEVVVTAQRQQSNAQTTPIAMTVYSAAAIQSQGIHDIASLSHVDPSVQFTPSNGAGYVSVRGIASTDLTEIGDPAVPVARDGFFTNRSYSLQASLYDVQQIEVLKGPQGTLFGRNSTGGLISIITQRPTHGYGGYVSAERGDFDTLNLEGAVNVPLSDKVQLRLSALSRYHAGYRNNGVAFDGGDDDHSRSIRAQLAAQPFDGFNALVNAQMDETHNVGDIARNTAFGVAPPTSSAKTFPVSTQALNRMEASRYHWEFSYAKLPMDATITYLGGYDEVHWKHALDATPFGTPAGGDLRQFRQQEHPITQNHEVRIASAADQRLTWQFGYFHFSELNTPLDSRLIHVGSAFNGLDTIHFTYRINSVSDAGFGQISYKLTDNLKLTGGARYTRDEKTRTGNAELNLNVATGGAVPAFVPHIITPGNGHVVESKPTWHAGLDYQVTPHSLLYAKYDTGFKSGGFNSNGQSASVNYGPETVTAYEVGSKNRFFDSALQLNGSAYYMDYLGYQASQFTPALGGGPGVQNAGSARIYGVDVDAIWLSSIGKFDANATWNHARFTVFKAVNSAGTATVSLAGNALPVAPDFAASVGFEHKFDVGSGSITGRIDGQYKSKYYFSFFNFADTAQKAYSTGNLSATYRPGEDARWDVQFYVRNFTDQVVFANVTQNTNSNSETTEYAPPRTYGVKLNVRW
jgi:iron complex outermembrane receptor protein